MNLNKKTKAELIAMVEKLSIELGLANQTIGRLESDLRNAQVKEEKKTSRAAIYRDSKFKGTNNPSKRAWGLYWKFKKEYPRCPVRMDTLEDGSIVPMYMSNTDDWYPVSAIMSL